MYALRSNVASGVRILVTLYSLAVLSNEVLDEMGMYCAYHTFLYYMVRVFVSNLDAIPAEVSLTYSIGVRNQKKNTNPAKMFASAHQGVANL